MLDAIQIAEMLSTRLCHDLTGPISAINNGGELLADEDMDMGDDAMELILNSAAEAAQRLQFYRQAYGRINDDSDALLSEKRDIVNGFFSATKMNVKWPEDDTVEISHAMMRLVMNLLIVGSMALIKGGELNIEVKQDENGNREASVLATGEIVKLDADYVRILNGEAQVSNPTPKTVQLALTRMFVEAMNGVLTVELAENEQLSMRLQQPAVLEEAA